MQVWRPVCGPVGERTDAHALERFSAAQAARVRARDADRSVRPVLRAAVRARLRHDDRQRAAARAAVVDRRRGDHRGEDRRRAARVLADSGRRRGCDRHHPQPEADSAQAARRSHQDADAARRQGRRSAGARHPGGRRRRDPRAGCAHRDRRRGRQAPHGDAHEARPRLRVGRQELRRGSRHRLDSDRLGALADQEGQLPRRGGAPRPDHRLRQAHRRRLDQRLDQRARRACRWRRS